MYCRYCGEQIADEAIMCVKCGAPVYKSNKFCQNCGKPTNPEYNICLNCGVKLKTAASDSYSEKDWLTTLLLSLLPMLLCIGGIHRFYTGHIAIGIIQLLTAGGCFIWQLVDIILIATEKFKDREGKVLLSKK